jgi:hypothetical protein
MDRVDYGSALPHVTSSHQGRKDALESRMQLPPPADISIGPTEHRHSNNTQVGTNMLHLKTSAS